MTLVSDAKKIFRAGVAGVEPGRAVRRNLRRRGSVVRVGGRPLRVGPNGSVRIVAIGKAAGAMLDAAGPVLGARSATLAVTPRGFPAARHGFRTVFGEHPVPETGSFRAGRALLEFVTSAEPADVVLFLISGGGSAVAEAPADGLTPIDLSRTTELLLRSGAPIGAMNAIRRHLSRIKGGHLAEAAGRARFATLALSDVVGDAPEDIASGPTVPDPSTFRDAVSAVHRYGLGSRLPAPVIRHLSDGLRGRRAETLKPGSMRFRGAPFVLIGSNRLALDAAAESARAFGYRTAVAPRPVVGETRRAASRFVNGLLGPRPGGPRAFLAGGETTVRLGARPGRGGRNQEFALSTARAVAGRNAVVLSAGTDGIDGPTDAAGGWVDGDTWNRSVRRGVDLPRALARHDAYGALDRLGSLWRTGPTGTNVMDLHIGLAVPPSSRNTAGSTKRDGVPSSRRRRS
jgi:glycerate 2-kinase